MRWVNAWTQLLEIVGKRRNVRCQLPDYSVIDVEDCKGWLQDSVYAGYQVEVAEGWVGHQRGVVVSRSQPEKSDSR